MLALACGLGMGTAARAEVLRFRHVPIDACGGTTLAKDAQGAIGQRSAWVGGVKQPYFGQFKPNVIVTFRHAYTGKDVAVPMNLPSGTPRMDYRRYSIMYIYGSFTIEALFLPDGSVETIYNSGVLRPVQP
jgi:hypothetical protein